MSPDFVSALNSLRIALKEASESNTLPRVREHLGEASRAVGRMEQALKAPPKRDPFGRPMG